MKYDVRIYFPSGSSIVTQIDGNKMVSPNFALHEYVNKRASEAIKLEIYPETWTSFQMFQRLRDLKKKSIVIFSVS